MSIAIYVCCRPANLTGSDHEMGRIKQARSSYTAETMASHLQWVPCRRYLTAFLYIPCPLHMHTIHTYGERQRVIKASLDSCYSRSKRPSPIPSRSISNRSWSRRPITEMLFLMTPQIQNTPKTCFHQKKNTSTETRVTVP